MMTPVNEPLANAADPQDAYFSGRQLFGDDFTVAQIDAWFKDEAEGYANLGAGNEDSYRYYYHKINALLGFHHLPKTSFKHALGLGSAYGDEFLPLLDSIERLTILDPSDAFAQTQHVGDVPCEYIRPNINGDLPFDADAFDLVTSFGVLHHIPNVSHVLAECHRCMSPNGYLLLREPIVSMGDWNQPRQGLTRRERGIPLDVLNQMTENTGFSIVKKQLCFFPLIPRLATACGVSAYNSTLFTRVDQLVSQLMSWNNRYHRTSALSKFAPSCAFYVLQKR